MLPGVINNLVAETSQVFETWEVFSFIDIKVYRLPSTIYRLNLKHSPESSRAVIRLSAVVINKNGFIPVIPKNCTPKLSYFRRSF